MKVKIGNKIYDAEKEPIMIILDDNDKILLGNMPKDNYKYCCFPENIDSKKVIKFMEGSNDDAEI